MMSEVKRMKYCVNGEWKESKTSKWLPVSDSSTGELIAEVPCCTQDELEEAVGFTLRKDEMTPQGPFGATTPDGPGGTPLQTALQGFAKRAAASARATTPETDGAPQRAVLEAFSKDTSAASERVKELLDDPTPEAAQKLLADLPSLIPDDPALAAVIAEAMAAEFGQAAQT